MRYLAQTRLVDDHWYPADPVKRAKVDEYLDLHHTFLRMGSGQYIFKKLFAPLIINKTYTDEDLGDNKLALKRALKNMEQRLTNHKYIAGDEISIADLSACFELDQTRILSLDLSKWPKTKAWLHMMIDENEINLDIA